RNRIIVAGALALPVLRAGAPRASIRRSAVHLGSDAGPEFAGQHRPRQIPHRGDRFARPSSVGRHVVTGDCAVLVALGRGKRATNQPPPLGQQAFARVPVE
ncbi:hypothetical protein RZS08_04510, partial [Arthrospira platensis SPKY1]|nr:hypothetical protein [Arthrospira platensis SPKY1]